MIPPDDGAQPPFRILFVCTGNVCRSPFAERIMRRLTHGLPVEVASAGISAALRLETPPHLAKAARGHEVDFADHRPRDVLVEDVRDADLVVGFEHQHVVDVATQLGADQSKVFTLPEIVRLLDRVPDANVGPLPQRARALVEVAHQRRRGAGRKGPMDAGVVDPIGRPYSVYVDSTEKVAHLCEMLVARLLGLPVT